MARISELVRNLEDFQAEHGNIEVLMRLDSYIGKAGELQAHQYGDEKAVVITEDLRN